MSIRQKHQNKVIFAIIGTLWIKDLAFKLMPALLAWFHEKATSFYDVAIISMKGNDCNKYDATNTMVFLSKKYRKIIRTSIIILWA